MNARRVAIEAALSADLDGIGRAFTLAEDSPSSVPGEGPGCIDRYTARSLIDGSGHLGMTSTTAVPAQVARMERHLYTTEAIFCAGHAVVLPVAPAGDAPRTEQVRGLLIEPGQGVVLDPGVWHAPCLGLLAPTSYYWYAAVDEAVETSWVMLDAGPVDFAHSEGAGHAA